MLENLGEGQGFLAKVCEDTPLFGGDRGLGCLWVLLVMWLGTELFACVLVWGNCYYVVCCGLYFLLIDVLCFVVGRNLVYCREI
jgi:hypothetical protein